MSRVLPVLRRTFNWTNGGVTSLKRYGGQKFKRRDLQLAKNRTPSRFYCSRSVPTGETWTFIFPGHSSALAVNVSREIRIRSILHSLQVEKFALLHFLDTRHDTRCYFVFVWYTWDESKVAKIAENIACLTDSAPPTLLD